ncbi:MAG TPA: TetR/AcrR family transcriptional regulator [Clostridia bacterium]|nr:TetR/AcrR family transcriptional regulator [Clostridia bacterium]
MSVQTNAQRSAKTISAIMQAALRLVRKMGWEKTSVKGICEEANVSVGAFYHHFSSKNELMSRSFLLFDDSMSEFLPARTGSPLQNVRAVLMVQTEFVAREAGPLSAEYYRTILTDSEHLAASPDRAYYRAVLWSVHEAKAHLKEGFTPEYAADFLIKFVRGCLFDWCLRNFSYDVVERTGKDLDVLMGALFH